MNLFAVNIWVMLEVAAIFEPIDGDGKIAWVYHTCQLSPFSLMKVCSKCKGFNRRWFCKKEEKKILMIQNLHYNFDENSYETL